jgi:hypothetical protein
MRLERVQTRRRHRMKVPLEPGRAPLSRPNTERRCPCSRTSGKEEGGRR